MIERRIRETVALVLSRGAKALEQTAGELERAAEELRQDVRRNRDDADAVWSERPPADTMTRTAPLRAVPDTPTDEPHVPPVRPPRMPDAPRPGRVDADVVADAPAMDADAGDGEPIGDASTLRDLASGTVSEIRARLVDLSPDELRSLREIETANRNRVTLLTAIDRALDDES